MTKYDPTCVIFCRDDRAFGGPNRGECIYPESTLGETDRGRLETKSFDQSRACEARPTN